MLLTDCWRAKVTDLGTSRLLRGHSTAQSSATPAYAGEGREDGWTWQFFQGVHREGQLDRPGAAPGWSNLAPGDAQGIPPHPSLAAPEQLLNGRVGLPSDVFSLGLLLHDLCTGEQPSLVGEEGRACYRRPLEPGRVSGRGVGGVGVTGLHGA